MINRRLVRRDHRFQTWRTSPLLVHAQEVTELNRLERLARQTA